MADRDRDGALGALVVVVTGDGHLHDDRLPRNRRFAGVHDAGVQGIDHPAAIGIANDLIGNLHVTELVTIELDVVLKVDEERSLLAHGHGNACVSRDPCGVLRLRNGVHHMGGRTVSARS